jgi:DNA-binding transcriptional ArsR family regulator
MKQRELERLVRKARESADLLKLLAHEARLLIVCFIGDGEMNVQELESLLGTSQSNASQHLGKLRNRGILETRKAGNVVFYRIKDQRVLSVAHSLQEIFCGGRGKCEL